MIKDYMIIMIKKYGYVPSVPNILRYVSNYVFETERKR